MPPRFLQKGPWVPLLPFPHRIAIMLFLGVTPFVTGIDFLMGENLASMTVVEKAMPYWAWGLSLLFGGILVLLGYLVRNPRVCIWGLWFSGSIFFALSIGIAWQTIDAAGGFRGPWLYTVLALSSFISALGYREQLNEEIRMTSKVLEEFESIERGEDHAD